MANRSMNKSQEISDSIDSYFDQDETSFWDKMYDYLFDCEREDCNEDYLARF